MCGRYALTSNAQQIAEVFECEIGPRLEPRYNIAPTQPAPAIRVRKDTHARRLELLRWGLIPHWAKDPTIGNRMINARSESASEKPAFRDAFRYRRCLIPADAFYEWKRSADRGKRPYAIRRADRQPFAFAGLWEHWQDAEGNELSTCTILTGDASAKLASIHERMPIILDTAAHDPWLDPTNQDRNALRELLAHRVGDDQLEMFAVSPLVNSPRNDAPECLVPLAASDDEAD